MAIYPSQPRYNGPKPQQNSLFYLLKWMSAWSPLSCPQCSPHAASSGSGTVTRQSQQHDSNSQQQQQQQRWPTWRAGSSHQSLKKQADEFMNTFGGTGLFPSSLLNLMLVDKILKQISIPRRLVKHWWKLMFNCRNLFNHRQSRDTIFNMIIHYGLSCLL